jgi:prepilin signal peptidase PulO-like enzyme (type II secretory pathway)
MAVLIFIIWLIFWSFGSVLLTRLSSNKFDKKEIKSVVLWLSNCPKCKKRLNPQNLIPLLSYIIQNWTCDHCSQKISPFYFIIELLSWLVFLLTYLFLPHATYLMLWFRLLINRALLLIMIYDFMEYELHIPILTIGLIISLLLQFLNLTWDYKIAFWCSITLFTTFLAIYYLSKLYVKYRYKKNFEWIWFWDVILAFFIWTLFPFVFQLNNLNFNTTNLLKLILAFVLISSILWIIIRVIKLLPKHSSHWYKDIVKHLNISWQHIIPFLPAMIITYRILLFQASSILKILLP